MTDNYGNASQPQNPNVPPPPPGQPGGQGGYPQQPGYGQQPGGYQPPAGGYGAGGAGVPGGGNWGGGTRDQSANGFFSALFDFSFSRFITLHFAKFIFILYIVVSVLAYLFWVIASFTQSAGFGLLVLIIGIPIALLYIIAIRLMLEFLVAQIRTAENTTVLAQRA